MTQRAFIRALWGSTDKSNDEGWITPSQRRSILDYDINNIVNSPFTAPFITYVFGKDNYDMLLQKGIKSTLIDPRPHIYDLQKEFWRHKLDILKYAMQNDHYEEVVYLDWDCIPLKPMSEEFWQSLAGKREIQANLQSYARRKCFWRKEDLRKVSNGGFLYLRGSSLPDEIIKAWNGLDPALKFWDEIAFSKHIDTLMDGWKGADDYLKNFEPDVCRLKKKSAYSEEINANKNLFFKHFIQSTNNKWAKEQILSGSK